MSISIYKAPIAEGVQLVTRLLIDEFNIEPFHAETVATQEAKPHFDKYLDTCVIFAESGYVDRVFRDSYYHYYSSKLANYKRDCIRLSFFEGDLDLSRWRSSDYFNEVKSNYRGYMILRPVIPFIIGRSAISPKLLKDNNFQICSTTLQTSFNGTKLSVEAFPHSSQDTETISCAETTLWAIMEYFSNRYPDYTSVLPSKIHYTLNKITMERQIPSRGLSIPQLSFALREFGFGTRIYFRDEYNEDFDRLISTYIESGIPLIIGIDNFPTGTIGHAVICVGHENISNEQIDNLTAYTFSNIEIQNAIVAGGHAIYDYDAISKEFIFIDDNFPSYQKAELNNPTIHYMPSWHTCAIKHFIVPLYHKIYLEAVEVKNFVIKFLLLGPEPLSANSNLLIKTFLTSSRSFKDGLSLESEFDSNVKEIILGLSLPKFIWVSELSTKTLLKEKKAQGLIILDATEPNISFFKPLIFAAYNDFILTQKAIEGGIEKKVLPLPHFKCFINNLKAINYD